MARSRRAWSVLRAEVREWLRESTSSTSFWTNAQLLLYANAAIDKRVMQLAMMDEGWVTDQVYTSLVADQREYAIPEGTGRVKKVSLRYTLGGVTHEIELERDDQWGKHIVHGVGPTSISGYEPKYQLQANLIYLEPRPRFSLADALQIDLESAPARLSDDVDKLDLRFPDVMEQLIVFDTVMTALAIESETAGSEFKPSSILRELHQEYEKAFIEFCTDRTEGVVIGRPFRQGA